MSSGVSMHAMTRSVPPHTPQCSMSMWKTRLNVDYILIHPNVTGMVSMAA